MDKQLWTNVTQKTNRQTTVVKGHTVNQETNNCGQSHTENQQTNNCGQTPHRKLNIKPTRTPLKERIEDKQLWTQKTNKQLWTNATPKTNRQTSVDKGHTVNQKTNNCGQTPHRKSTDKQLWTNTTQKTKH